MPTIDIPFACCQRLQVKLREISQGSEDPDLRHLLQEIDSACLTFAPVTSVSLQVPLSQGRKRPAARTTSSHSSKAVKTSTMTSARNTRNDGRKRRAGYRVEERTRDNDPANHEREPTPSFDEPGPVTGVVTPPNVEQTRDADVDRDREAAQIPPTPFPIDLNTFSSGDSELSSLTSDDESSSLNSDTSASTQPKEPKPKAAPERSRKPIPKPWETVDDVRLLTPKASRVLQTLASVAERENFTHLDTLKNNLSAQSELQAPEPTSLQSLVWRCVHYQAKVVEDRLKYMISLIQLALWLDQ